MNIKRAPIDEINERPLPAADRGPSPVPHSFHPSYLPMPKKPALINRAQPKVKEKDAVVREVRSISLTSHFKDCLHYTPVHSKMQAGFSEFSALHKKSVPRDFPRHAAAALYWLSTPRPSRSCAWRAFRRWGTRRPGAPARRGCTGRTCRPPPSSSARTPGRRTTWS